MLHYSLQAHLYKLPIVFQLFLERLDTLTKVFRVILVLQLFLQEFSLLIFELSLQVPEAQRERLLVLLRLPLQVQPVLGQTLCLCQQSLEKTKRKGEGCKSLQM